MIRTRNETENETIKKKYGPIIQQAYEKYGFPKLTIDTVIDASNEEWEKFWSRSKKKTKSGFYKQ